MDQNKNILSDNTVYENPAYIFDIDGVFLKGGALIDKSKEAFKRVKDKNIPYIFLTNSTGCNTKKAELLTQLLGVKVHPNEVVMAQSPVADLFNLKNGIYKDKNCLLISSNNDQAEQTFSKLIGLKRENYVTTDEINEKFPNLDWMNREKWSPEVDTSPRIKDEDFKPIECIVLLGEPVNWERSIQILLDVILGKGHPNQRVASYPDVKNDIPIIAANLDLCWKGAANMPRFGNGAFLLMLETFYKKFTGNDLKYEKMYGKPSHHTYEYCLRHLHKLYPNQKIANIICIGDNPASDIAGANNIKNIDKDHTWLSVLVETGVYKPEPEEVAMKKMKFQDNSKKAKKINHAHRDFLDISVEADFIIYDLYQTIQKFT